jgi:hypothetical protein
MNIYTGIGSRETPPDVYALMVALASLLARAGWTLRSGAADGADSAFEQGCDAASGKKEIFLAWRGFNGSTSERYRVSSEALEMASTLHPAWERLGQGPRKLHARNCNQVLGDNLDNPSHAVICWTKDGCETRKQRTNLTGGTGTAIVLADIKGVPVFNLKNDASRERLAQWLLARGVNTEGLELVRAPQARQSDLF